jgi:chaperonin GroEL
MNNPKKKKQRPEVIFQPKAYRSLKRGIDQLADTIKPTLGPFPRLVAIQRIETNQEPELLDSGGTIARRIIQIRNRDDDMGAMFLRHVLWELYEKVGDGTATTAVMFQSIFEQGIRYATAGGNPMRLRIFLEEAVRLVLDDLQGMKHSLEGKEALGKLAYSICHDIDLARMMGEIFDILGEFGRLEIRSGRSRELEREYIEGMYWDGGLVSREMMTDPENLRSFQEDAALVISDLRIEEPQDCIPLLEFAVQNKLKALFFMCAEITDRALSIFLANKEKVEVVVVKAPFVNLIDRLGALEDMAILSGGIPLYSQAGERLSSIRLQNIGRARRIWANLHSLVIVGGKGDSKVLRQHIATLRAAFTQAKDAADRKRLRERIGKIMGGSATLWVGGSTPIGVEKRKELAEHTAEAMRGALRDGVVAGGGIAFLACRPHLQQQARQTVDVDQRAAYSILAKALGEPARVILDNVGVDSYEILARMRLAGPGYGYDIDQGEIVDMVEAGICDSAAVVREAVFSAVHGAALALTTDVLVHRKLIHESISSTG